MSQPVRASYVIMAALLVLVGWLHLGTLALTSLFGYFALQFFSFRRHKGLGVAIYIVAVAMICTGLVYFSRQAYVALPKIADTTIPAVVGFAEKQGLELPFTDYESLKTVALNEAQEGIAGVGRYVRAAGFQLVLLVAGLVVAASLFLNSPWGAEAGLQTAQDSLYATVMREVAGRFRTFFHSFAKVIGAQIVISTINTGLTAVFLTLNGYPFAAVLIVLTFLCGLIPIIGNLVSNALIVGVGFSVSPRTALFAMVFLVVIHKLEYFLNSKIIGERIKNPVWATLIALIVGDMLIGIPGMILAPVILYYLRLELSQVPLPAPEPPRAAGPAPPPPT